MGSTVVLLMVGLLLLRDVSLVKRILASLSQFLSFRERE